MTLHKELTKFLLPTLVFLTPLLFTPLSTTPSALGKQLLLLAITLTLFLSWIIQSTRSNSLTLARSSLNLPLALITISTIINLILVKEGRPEALVGKGSLILILAMLSYIISSTSSPKMLNKFTTYAVMTSSLILSVFSILHLTLLHSQTFLPAFMQTRQFSPAGSPVVAVVFILIGLVTSLSYAYLNRAHRTVSLVFSAINLIAAVAYISLMLPGGELALVNLPLTATWSIVLDTAKNLRTAIFGSGLANFTQAYTATKPLYLNETIFWNVLPTAGWNEFFTIFITGGATLALSFIYFAGSVIRHLFPINSPVKAGFLFTLISLLVLPGSLVTYVLFFVFAGLIASESSTSYDLSLPEKNGFKVGLIASAFLISGFLVYSAVKVALGEYYLSLAQLAVSQGDGKKAYETTMTAIKFSPFLTSYRISYSQINLSLANALSKNKTNPIEEDRSQIAQLVQQAIREGRVAASLSPSQASVWQNLSIIYKNLIGAADGADKFAISYMGKSVSLDSGNPALRLEYANLLRDIANTKKDATESGNLRTLALSEYSMAVKLKGDYANAYYNLGKILEQMDNTDGAVSALEKTVSLLKKDSNDYMTAKSDLDALKNKPKSESPKVTPSSTPSPSPMVDGPIVLPEESPTP